MTRMSDKDTTSPISWDSAFSSFSVIAMRLNALRYFPKLYVESLVDVFCQKWTGAPEIQHPPGGGIALHSG